VEQRGGRGKAVPLILGDPQETQKAGVWGRSRKVIVKNQTRRHDTVQRRSYQRGENLRHGLTKKNSWRDYKEGIELPGEKDFETRKKIGEDTRPPRGRYLLTWRGGGLQEKGGAKLERLRCYYLSEADVSGGRRKGLERKTIGHHVEGRVIRQQ